MRNPKMKLVADSEEQQEEFVAVGTEHYKPSFVRLHFCCIFHNFKMWAVF